MSKHEWVLVRKLPKGHRIWLDTVSGRYAIRDPDDGILWLRKHSPVWFGEEYASIPLYKERDNGNTEECHTLESHENAYRLCLEVKMKWVVNESLLPKLEIFSKILEGRIREST